MTSESKQFGIRVTLPEGDPMALPHLLGEHFEQTRWYADAATRDAAFDEMSKTLVYYREGDHPSQILEKIG